MSPWAHSSGPSWDHSCCALKLVKLAAGVFDAEHVLGEAATDQEQSQPSWTIAGTSPTANEENRTMKDMSLPCQQQPPSDSKRSQWTRPWREARQRPMLRWKMSGPAPPKRTPVVSTAADAEVKPSTKRKIFVDLPSVLLASPMPPEYTTKYFGMVGGELGVMSKAEPLGPRPASPELWRVAASIAENSTAAAAAAAAVAENHVDAHQGRSPLSSPPGSSNSPAKDRSGGTSSARKRRGQLFTAAKPPVTRPVEGPEPPAWSGSRSGLLCDASDGRGGVSVVELALAGAEHGGSINLAGARGVRAQLIGSDSSSTMSVAGSGGLRSTSYVEGSEDDSSAFALSVVSAPWAGSGDEGSEKDLLQTSLQQRSAEVGRRRGSGAMPAARKARVLKKARCLRRGRRKTRARCDDGAGAAGNHVVELIETHVSKDDASFREKEEEEGDMGSGGEGNDLQQPTVITNNGAQIASHREPQPELYDVWIPQQFFKGKGLPTPRRVNGESEPQIKSPLGSSDPVAAQPEIAANAPAGSTHGATTNAGSRHPVKRFGEPKEPLAAGKRYAVRYVSGPEDFATGDAAMPPVDWTPPGDTGSSDDAGSEHLVLSRGDEHDDRYGIAPDKLSHDDVGGGGPVAARDFCADILEGDGGIVGWQEEGGERSGGESDDEHFDYANRFSWQTAVDVVAEAQAEEDARSYDERSRGRPGGNEILDNFEDVDERDGARHLDELQRQQRAAAAAAAERARVRSDHAALVAVGRLRAPQSVFHPLHRTPSRPEMRRSVTHGRFSPVGRKLWRQSEGLCPRTGQLCLSPRRRSSRGGVVVVGEGDCSSSPRGGQINVCGWAELCSPSMATHQEKESRWDFSGVVPSAVDEEDVGDIGVPLSGGGGGGDPRVACRPARGKEHDVKGEEDDRLVDVNGFDGGGQPYPLEEENGRSGGGLHAVGTAAGGAAYEDDAISGDDPTHGEEFRHGCSSVPVDCPSADGIEDGSDADVECVTPTSEGADPPPPSITRCLSNTVKIPWGG